MNEDESGRIVHEGAWPLIAGRRANIPAGPAGRRAVYQMGAKVRRWTTPIVPALHPGGILMLRIDDPPEDHRDSGGASVRGR
jgi:hypothetical protein